MSNTVSETGEVGEKRSSVICFRIPSDVRAVWSQLDKGTKMELTRVFKSIIVEFVKSGRVLPVDVTMLKEALESCQLAYEQLKRDLEKMRDRVSKVDRVRKELEDCRRMLEDARREIEQRDAEIARLRTEIEELRKQLSVSRMRNEMAKELRRIICLNLDSLDQHLRQVLGDNLYARIKFICSSAGKSS